MPNANPGIALRKRLDQRVRSFMLDSGLWPATGTLLLAVSGGPDSTALLLILSRLVKYQQVALQVAYFDHGLRSDEARGREATFVRDLCRSLDLPFVLGSGDVKARAGKDRRSLEDAGRRERYEFLARTALEIGATHVATGHTSSDQAETVLQHIIRGSGLDGLAGMAPISRWPVDGGAGLSLVRPLLVLSRSDTHDYCHAASVAPISDESNDSGDFTRNRIRHEVLPLLRTFNPKVEDALVRLANAAAEQRSPAIREALIAAVGAPDGLSARHIAAVERLQRTGRTGDRITLPGSIEVRRTRDGVVVEAGAERELLPDEAICVIPGGETRFGQLTVQLASESPASPTAAVEVDADSARDVRVRRRRNGDRMQPAGMAGTKKLQDLFVDAQVDRTQRDRVPIFETDRGILWVGGLRLAEWARPRTGHPTVWLSYREAP